MSSPRRSLFSGLTMTLAVGATVMVSACAPPSSSSSSSSSAASAGGGAAGTSSAPAADAKTAKSAADLGGMDALAAAAKAEGTLNVIALPKDWANYGAVMDAFTKKYGVAINSSQPDISSQEEINAIKNNKGTDRAPDVVDVGMAVAWANTDQFAPYQVATWKDIPDSQKEATGLWFQDYGGYMAIGYDSAKVPAITGVKDLLKPEFKGKVALYGDPTKSNTALNAVMLASLANGGSIDDISKGVDFFKQLKAAGNFVPVQAKSATIKNGTTPVVFNWDYLATTSVKDVPTWKVLLPSDFSLGGYYAQAINKEAPHPAAARLWEEFLFSDEGQNLWLNGGARPVRQAAMTTAGTIDAAAAAKLPKVVAQPVLMDEKQAGAANAAVLASWAKAIG